MDSYLPWKKLTIRSYALKILLLYITPSSPFSYSIASPYLLYTKDSPVT